MIDDKGVSFIDVGRPKRGHDGGGSQVRVDVCMFVRLSRHKHFFVVDYIYYDE